MAAPTKQYLHGQLPAYDIQNETGLITTKGSHTMETDQVRKKNAYRCTFYVREEDPIYVGEFGGHILPDGGGALQGFCLTAAGSHLTATLSNLAAGFHGVAQADMYMIFRQPKRETSDTETPQESFTAQGFPFVVAGS